MTTVGTPNRSRGREAQAQGEALAGAWFNSGERVGYDPTTRSVTEPGHAPLSVWLRRDGDATRVVSFLPGYPDGSIGWSKLLPELPDAAVMPKLFVEYLGMGDSDKPRGYAFSTAERTDLVEALLRHYGVKSTTLVAFDFSGLVVLEHLRRRMERAARGEPTGGPEIRGVIIFNGALFADGHSHPWFTTPLLRQPGGGIIPWFGQRSFWMFSTYLKTIPAWSPSYGIGDEEVQALRSAMSRRNGMFFLSAAAGFVAVHQRQAERLDFGRVFDAYQQQFPFMVGSSDEDVFERRQTALAEERLGGRGLQIARLPGGHFTATERPAELANLIANFERDAAAHAARH
jgi:pimeloyl-ACP methyl ester carboxylesterase